MKKERTIKELLELLLENKNLFETGLCFWSEMLYCRKLISCQECSLLIYYIKKNRPFIFSSMEVFKQHISIEAYYWEIRNINPRIQWIHKHIKKNS